MESIILKIEAHVAFITLNRPASYNSFNREMALLLQHILNDCAKNPDVRAICITGEGKAFCAGQDLKEVTDPMGPSLTTILREHYNPIILRLRKIEKPVIAAILMPASSISVILIAYFGTYWIDKTYFIKTTHNGKVQ